MIKFNTAAVFLATFTSFTSASDDIPTLQLSLPYQPLAKLPSFPRDESGHLNAQLRMNVANYVGPSYNTKIRVYNGLPVGPTIRVKPGETFTLELHNDLEQPLGHDAHNSPRQPNTTNVHTHGPHISGMDPGDNVFIEVPPGGSHNYTFTVGKDHMPGTFWYHPHFHGSTFTQTSDAFGMLIIEDPEDYLPKEYADMPEIDMVLSEHYLPFLQSSSKASGDLLGNWTEGEGFTVTNATTADMNLRFVNKQYKPLVTMEENKWYRWRMVHASSFGATYLDLPSGCEFQLLAKDGIYLQDFPRAVPKILLVPGQRADVAVRCSASAVGSQPVKSIWWRGNFDADRADRQDLMELSVVRPSLPHPRKPLTRGTIARRPCYQVDLRDEEVQKDNTFNVDFRLTNGTGFINDVSWHNTTTYFKHSTLGTVQEVVVLTSGNHPYHQHVNPMQIQSIDAVPLRDAEYNRANEAWYKVGDWHDTFMYPVNNTDPITKFKYAADQFSGHMIFHCHMLNHEDRGMMGQYNLVGEEGTMWSGARDIDPTCILPDEPPKSSKAAKERRNTGLRRSVQQQRAK